MNTDDVIKKWQEKVWSGQPADGPYTAGDLLTLLLDIRADGDLDEFFDDIDKTTGEPA